MRADPIGDLLARPRLGEKAVSRADPVDERPGFAAMLRRVAGNGVRTIIVETANGFAPDLIV